jgi:hypothetical protein
MPKVGIMVNVSTELLETVINPAKAEKRFKRLVVQLLEAYHSDEKVRAIVDGDEALANLEGLSSLKEQLQQASQTVAYMGMVNESIQLGLDSAKSEFETGEFESKGTGVRLNEFEDFKQEMLEQQTSFMNDMRSLMQEFITGSVSKPKVATAETIEPPVVVEPIQTSSVPENIIEMPTPTTNYDAGDLLDFEEIPEEDEVSSMSADDILSKLVGSGNEFNLGG